MSYHDWWVIRVDELSYLMISQNWWAIIADVLIVLELLGLKSFHNWWVLKIDEVF
jgi:hypothetical protein